MKLLFFIIFSVFAATATADYPKKPIELIVGNAPGGSSDVVSRALARSLEPILGQPVIVVNRAGAGGAIAVNSLIASRPDGHTVMLGSISTLTVGPHCADKLPYDSTKDITPVAMFGNVPNIMAINAQFPATDYQSFLKTVRSSPGRYNYSGHLCSQFWLMGEMLKSKTNIDIKHIPYTSLAQSRMGAINNDVQMLIESSLIMPNIESGQLRAIAVGSKTRMKTLPLVPTFAELGIPEANIVNWYGVVAPAGTPQHIIDTLNVAIKKATQDKALIDLLHSWQGTVEYVNAKEFSKQIDYEWNYYGKVVRQAKKTIEN